MSGTRRQRASTTNATIDYSKLEKGSVISVPELEKHFGAKVNSDKYAFCFMALQKSIEQHFAANEVIVTTQWDQGALRVCTDVEASTVNTNRFASGLAKMKAATHRMQGVDTDGLPADRAREHNHNLTKMSVTMQAVQNSRRRRIT